MSDKRIHLVIGGCWDRKWFETDQAYVNLRAHEVDMLDYGKAHQPAPSVKTTYSTYRHEVLCIGELRFDLLVDTNLSLDAAFAMLVTAYGEGWKK